MRATRLIALLTGFLLAGAAVSAQTLGDVAKKEEERRKQAPAGKVYTNKDLGAVPPSSVPPPPPVAEAEGGAKPAADAPADKDSKDAAKDGKGKEDTKGQAYWSGRRRDLQSTLDKDATLADALQSRVNALTTDFVNRDNPVERANIEKDRQKALGELTRLRKQVVDDRKALTDLEEEARRAGVPPGWLR